MKTSVRSAFKAIRMLRKYHRMKKTQQVNFKVPSFFMMFETGFHSTFSGLGDLLKSFLNSKSLENYSGFDSEVAHSNESGFWNSKLRYLPFASTFTHIPLDVNQR